MLRVKHKQEKDQKVVPQKSSKLEIKKNLMGERRRKLNNKMRKIIMKKSLNNCLTKEMKKKEKKIKTRKFKL